MAAQSKTVHNERMKLYANALNALALSFAVTGGVVPLVSLSYGSGTIRTSWWPLAVIWWVLLATLLHRIAHQFIKEIRE